MDFLYLLFFRIFFYKRSKIYKSNEIYIPYNGVCTKWNITITIIGNLPDVLYYDIFGLKHVGILYMQLFTGFLGFNLILELPYVFYSSILNSFFYFTFTRLQQSLMILLFWLSFYHNFKIELLLDWDWSFFLHLF